MFGRVPGTRPNISESHSETSTRVPFCIEGRLAALELRAYALAMYDDRRRARHVAEVVVRGLRSGVAAVAVEREYDGELAWGGIKRGGGCSLVMLEGEEGVRL